MRNGSDFAARSWSEGERHFCVAAGKARTPPSVTGATKRTGSPGKTSHLASRLSRFGKERLCAPPSMRRPACTSFIANLWPNFGSVKKKERAALLRRSCEWWRPVPQERSLTRPKRRLKNRWTRHLRRILISWKVEKSACRLISRSTRLSTKLSVRRVQPCVVAANRRTSLGAMASTAVVAILGNEEASLQTPLDVTAGSLSPVRTTWDEWRGCQVSASPGRCTRVVERLLPFHG